MLYLIFHHRLPFFSATCVLSRFTWKMPTFPDYSSPCELTWPHSSLNSVGYSPPSHLESQMITIDFLDGLWFISPAVC